MSVYDLTKEQMEQLKQNYVFEKNGNNRTSWNELAKAACIPNEVICKHYADYDFSEDDFDC